MNKNKLGIKDKFILFFLSNRALLLDVIFFVFLSITSKQFLSIRNLTNVTRQISANTIIGIGYTFLLASGYVDLSVGAMLCMIGIIAGLLSQTTLPFVVILIICILIGIFCGALNTIIGVKFNLPPFLVTLAMQQIYKAVMLLLSNGQSIPNLHEGIVFMGQGSIGQIPVCSLLMIILIVLGSILLTKTGFGRTVLVVGGNQEAARVSGINVNFTRIKISMLLGALVAVTSFVSIGRVGASQTSIGADTVMDVIAAVVIGGTPMGGGSGTVVGTLFGCLTIGLISNGLNLLQVSSYWQTFAKGVIILVAVIMDMYTEKIHDKLRNKE